MKYSLVTPYRERKGQYENLKRLIDEAKDKMKSVDEIIISEYGLPDEGLDRLGVKVFREPTQGVWNRPRAVNNGLRQCINEYAIVLDSDCIPIRDLDIILAEMNKRKEAVILWVMRGNFLDTHSPGNFSIKVKSFWEIGGYDERFKGYGRADKDFEYRLQENNQLLYLPFCLRKEDGKTNNDLSEQQKQEWEKNKKRFEKKHGKGALKKIYGKRIKIEPFLLY